MEKKTIGAFIAALRKASGMTQQELADRLNISNKAVSRWERDECAPDISLILAIAEIFGVTCDELLKGERILTEPMQEKSEPKVEKQLKSLINRCVSGFKTLIFISLTLCAVGFICMLGISYGFFRPVIGFAVMMLFETAAFIIAVIAVNKMKEAKRENELFENADIRLIDKYNKALGNFSYAAYFSIISVIALCLPLICFVSDNVDSVLTFESYFGFFSVIALVLVLVFFALRDIYCSWITGQHNNKAVKNANPRRRTMNILQLSVIMFAGIVYLVYPYFESPDDTLQNNIYNAGALVLVAAVIVLFIFFILRFKSDRKELILPGLRNLLLIIPLMLIRVSHFAAFYSFEENPTNIENIGYDRYVIWNKGYVWIIAVSVLLIFVVFRAIEKVVGKKSDV